MAKALLDIAYHTIIDRPCPQHGLVAVGLRCAWCGHRLPVDGVPPTETRRLPFWTWPGEIVGRFRAMRAGSGPADDAWVDAEFIDPADFFGDSGEVVFVDDGLGEDVEADLEAWEANRD